METLKSYNPATGEILGEVEITPAVEVPNIVARAKAAQLAWGDLGLEGRAELLKATADIFVDRVQEHGELMTKEMGKPLKEAIGEAKPLGWGKHSHPRSWRMGDSGRLSITIPSGWSVRSHRGISRCRCQPG